MEEQELMKAEGLQRMPPAVLLMRDIYEVWRDDEAFIPTRNLVDRLILENAEAWSERSDYGKDLTPQRLGRMLATNWRIHTWQRPDGDRARGYRRQQFADAWRQVVRMGANVSNGTNGTNGSHSHPYGKEAA